jgi:hypothetical protein
VDAFTGARMLSRAEEADMAVRELLSTLTGNRELLLACLLSGKSQFMNECRRAFHGLAIDDGIIEHCWYFLVAKRGPGNIAEEFEWLQAIREGQDEKARTEAEALKELADKAHGKDADAERGKFGEFPIQGAGRA